MSSKWPTQQHPFISWFCYVAAGATSLERRARLSECPVELRDQVRERFERFFEESKKARRTTGENENV